MEETINCKYCQQPINISHSNNNKKGKWCTCACGAKVRIYCEKRGGKAIKKVTWRPPPSR